MSVSDIDSSTGKVVVATAFRINANELSALRGLPALAQRLYLLVIRPATTGKYFGLDGDRSWRAIADILSTDNRAGTGNHERRPSRPQLLCAVTQLALGGLVNILAKDRFLTACLPLMEAEGPEGWDGADADSRAPEAIVDVPELVPDANARTVLWHTGVRMVGRVIPDPQAARRMIGRLIRQYGERRVAQSILRAESIQPANPVTWLVAALQADLTTRPQQLSAVERVQNAIYERRARRQSSEAEHEQA